MYGLFDVGLLIAVMVISVHQEVKNMSLIVGLITFSPSVILMAIILYKDNLTTRYFY